MPLDLICDEMLLVVLLAPVPSRERCGELRRNESLVSRKWNAAARLALASPALGIHDVRWCGMVGLCIPRSAEAVPPIAVLGLGADDECEQHLLVTGTAPPGGLRVSAAFRMSDTNVGEEYWTEADRLSHGERMYCESVKRDDEFYIVVSLRGVLPLLRAVDGAIDLTVLPAVFRAAVGLAACSVPSADYTPGLSFVYKRIVRGSVDTTVREVWDAIGGAEGWDPRRAADYMHHHGGAPYAERMTVCDWFLDQTPELPEFDVDDAAWRRYTAELEDHVMDSGDTLHFAWPACELARRHCPRHAHFCVRW